MIEGNKERINPLTLYSIGHSNFTPDEFLTTLQHHRITVLVDVCSRPYSKYVPHFGKDLLEAFLVKNGIEYRFEGVLLGGQPDDETVYKTSQKPGDKTRHKKYLKLVDYEVVMQRDWYQRGIYQLLDLVLQTPGRVAILGNDSHPRNCHRHCLIARSLLDPLRRMVDELVGIIHILQDGSTETLTPSEFDEPLQLGFDF